MFKFLVLLSALIMTIASVFALPSDILTYHPDPQIISLHNVNSECAKLIDADNSIAAWTPSRFPQFGHLRSDVRRETQSLNDTIPDALTAFASAKVQNLSSIGPTTGNFTMINETIAWF